MGIKAIETVYKGYRFRSRLEARWAVFFDTLGIPWEYEKEGYDLDGVWYLPDFWLPEQQTWVEVKGQEPTADEHEKAKRLCNLSGHTVLFHVDIPDVPAYSRISAEALMAPCQVFGSHAGYTPWSTEPLTFHWNECYFCAKHMPVYRGTKRAELWTPCECVAKAVQLWPNIYSSMCFFGSISHYSRNPDAREAYLAARQARFEHGEHP